MMYWDGSGPDDFGFQCSGFEDGRPKVVIELEPKAWVCGVYR